MSKATKQEEIRYSIITNITKVCPNMLNRDAIALADKILKDENSQGAVIKVDRLPIKGELEAQYEKEYLEGSTNMTYDHWYSVKLLYQDFEYVAVEPLIKEVDND